MAQTLEQQSIKQTENSSSKKEHTTSKPPSQLICSTRENIKSNRFVKTIQQSAAASNDSSCSNNPLNHQPSKIFISKCRAEFEALLTAIKDTYHQEIKNLYQEQFHPDLFIQFGEEEFKKPLHRCVVASRAYKLYNSLKAFKLIEVPVEQDIIIREFQKELNLDEGEKNLKIAGKSEEVSESVSNEDTEELLLPKQEEEEPILHCNLPNNLISPDLLLNFVRRVYLDQDISQEEFDLNKRLIDWLKQNKPELFKSPAKKSINHRESFRTIQPDYNETVVITTPNMSADQQLINLTDDGDSNVDDQDETSQSMSIKDVSLTGSLLTRTETFELLTKSNVDSSSSAMPSKNVLADEHENSDAGTEVTTEDATSPFVPTTRTGLKPKTFTTPKGLQTNRSNPSSFTGPKSQTVKRDSISTKTKQAAPKPQPTKQHSTGNNYASSTASKRSSLSSNISESMTESNKLSATSKTKTTVITRAQPISMERSQSPGVSVIKGTTRNFIAANKRLISQIEKKSVPHHEPPIDDAEVDNIENSFLMEPLTSDNLIANMDRFTLISYSKLADALSSMFTNEMLTDTIILVRDEKQIMAHRCILAARSAYLSELLAKQCLPSINSQSSSESRLLKIDLTEYSYPVVYFSILHIYSGIVKVPEDINIEELAKLTHHLHVTTLTQVCLQNLRMNYCHFFHKPCNVCCIGVLKTLPLAWRYDYTELYSKCLQWIGTHFASIFCLKEFSELKPHDLLEECYSATLSQLTPENIIPKTIECQKLLKSLPRVKWSESIICLVGRQLEDFCHYVAENYEKILQSESFMNLSKNCWECEVLEENLLAAMNQLKPDSGCKTLIQLHKIECSMESYCEDPRNASDSFVSLILKMRKYCERYLLKEATAVVHCSSWRQMNPSLQKRIKDQAIIATDFEEPTKQLASKPKLPSMSRHHPASSSPVDSTRSPSNRSTPDPKIKSPSTTLLPPPKNKAAAARHVKVLK